MENQERKKCLICADNIAENLKTPSIVVQNVLKTCFIHLEGSVSQRLLSGMKNVDENELPVCQDCFYQTTELLEADTQLEEMKAVVPKLKARFIEAINKKRSLCKTGNQASSSAITDNYSATGSTTGIIVENISEDQKFLPVVGTSVEDDNDPGEGMSCYRNADLREGGQFILCDENMQPRISLQRLRENPFYKKGERMSVTFETVPYDLKPSNEVGEPSSIQPGEVDDSSFELNEQTVQAAVQGVQNNAEPVENEQPELGNGGNSFSEVAVAIPKAVRKSGRTPTKYFAYEAEFTAAINLGKQKIIQTAKPKYSCSSCNKLYVRKGNLYRHENTHKGKRFFDSSQ